MRTSIISIVLSFLFFAPLLSQRGSITSVSIIEVNSYTKKVNSEDINVDLPFYIKYFKTNIPDSELSEWAFLWSIDNQEQSTESVLNAKFPKSGTYSIELTVSNKANPLIAFTAVPINVDVTQEYRIPNVITPNSDGKNDEIVILNDSNTNMIFTVFDKAGTLVFKGEGAEIYWKGIDNNSKELPSAIYYYVLETDGSSDVKKSFIYLYR